MTKAITVPEERLAKLAEVLVVNTKHFSQLSLPSDKRTKDCAINPFKSRVAVFSGHFGCDRFSTKTVDKLLTDPESGLLVGGIQLVCQNWIGYVGLMAPI